MSTQPLLFLVVSDADPLRADLTLRSYLAENAALSAHVGMVCVGESPVVEAAYTMIQGDFPGLRMWHGATLETATLDALQGVEQVLMVQAGMFCTGPLRDQNRSEGFAPGQWATLARSTAPSTAVLAEAPSLRAALVAAAGDLDAALASLTEVPMEAPSRVFSRTEVVSAGQQTLPQATATARFVAGERAILPEATSTPGIPLRATLGEVERWPWVPARIA